MGMLKAEKKAVEEWGAGFFLTPDGDILMITGEGDHYFIWGMFGNSLIKTQGNIPRMNEVEKETTCIFVKQLALDWDDLTKRAREEFL